MSFNVRVEMDYEHTPIRRIAVQCPDCKNWFDGKDITNYDLGFRYEIKNAHFDCPVCGNWFGGCEFISEEPHIKEVSYPEIYEGCLKQKVVWE